MLSAVASFRQDTAKDFRLAVRDLEAEGCDKFIIDLRDKIDVLPSFEAKGINAAAGDHMSEEMNEARHEAAQALVALGYSQTDSYKAVRSVKDADDVETILKSALSVMSRL